MLRYLHTLFYVLGATILTVSLCFGEAALAQNAAPTASETPAALPESLPAETAENKAEAEPESSDKQTNTKAEAIEENTAADENAAENAEASKETDNTTTEQTESKPAETTPAPKAVKRIGSVPNMAESEVDYVGLLEESLAIDPQPIPKKFPIWDGDDNELILKDFKGKLVILNFWATWCTPCALEMPELDALQEYFDDAELPVKVIALSEDFKGAEVVKQFYAENEIKHLDIYIDKKNAFFRELGIISLPTTLLIDQEGEEVLRISGYVHWNSQEVLEFLCSFIWEE